MRGWVQVLTAKVAVGFVVGKRTSANGTRRFVDRWAECGLAIRTRVLACLRSLAGLRAEFWREAGISSLLYGLSLWFSQSPIVVMGHGGAERVDYF